MAARQVSGTLLYLSSENVIKCHPRGALPYAIILLQPNLDQYQDTFFYFLIHYFFTLLLLFFWYA